MLTKPIHCVVLFALLGTCVLLPERGETVHSAMVMMPERRVAGEHQVARVALWRECQVASGWDAAPQRPPEQGGEVGSAAGAVEYDGGCDAAPLDGTGGELADPKLDNWSVIVSEDFEGDFPGEWEVFSSLWGSGYYWGQRDCRPHSGSYSGWAVGDGAAFCPPARCGACYPESTQAWMIYGPFDLSDAREAELRFSRWNHTEGYWDYLFWGASLNGEVFYGERADGDSGGWRDEVFDLREVPVWGDVTGESQVWVGFLFAVYGSGTCPEGAYVDDIVLREVRDVNLYIPLYIPLILRAGS